MYSFGSKELQPECFYRLAELFNKSQKGSGFPDFWKIPVIKNVGERYTDFSKGIKVFEELVNNRIVDPLKKCCLFYFQYGFSSSRSTDISSDSWMYLIE